MKPAALFCLLSAWTLILACRPAAGAEYGLQTGGQITVDPDTNRATITRDGVTTPLWDGTHRMQDGSILIIRQGISVPRETVTGIRQPPLPPAEQWEGTPIVGYSPCEKLVYRTCGSRSECLRTESCDLALQLLTMEDSERSASGNPNRMTYTSGQCQEVAGDMELFPYCK